MPPDDGCVPTVGMTVREVARMYRVGTDKVRTWIKSGRLGGINTASTSCSKPRYIVLPRHLEEFERQRSATPAPKPERQQRRAGWVDYYPD
jgi:transposase